MEDSGANVAGSEADTGSCRTLPRLIGAFAAGVTATVVASLLVALVTPWLLPVAPVAGAAVAGYLARVGRVGGALLGAVVLAAVGTGVLAGGWLLATMDPPRTGGAGVGLVVAFLFLALGGLFGVVLGGFGGLIGVVARQRRARSNESIGDATEPASRRTGSGPDDDPARPVHPGPRSDHGATTSDTTARPDTGSGTTAAHVLVGSGIAVGTCVVPFAPVAAGFATGYLEGEGPRRGAASGAVAGGVATVLLVAGLVLFAFVPVNVLAPFIFEFLPELVLLLSAYFVLLGAAGGAFGGSVAS